MMEAKPHWKNGSTKWFKVHPKGLHRQLAWLKENYGDLEYLITENGYAGRENELQDDDRVEYLRAHMEQVLLSIKEDGVNVTHYTVWSLIDNFEWMDGYNTRFGLYEVDFSDPMRTRTPRKSARYYASVISSHSLDGDKPNKYIKDEL